MTSKALKRTQVFISYSHKDRRWLEYFRPHIKPLIRDEKIDIWDDTTISSGLEWRAEIDKAIRTARVAVLFVSAAFFSSDFIVKDELPPLIEAAQRGEILIIPVIISASRFLRDKNLSKFQAINDSANPLIKLTKGEREDIFDRLARSIELALNSSGSRISKLGNTESRSVSEGLTLKSRLKKLNNTTDRDDHTAVLALPSSLSIAGFAYPRPRWLTADSKQRIDDLARAALVLLAFERTNTGCWGKTYLYRRQSLGEMLPLAGGALTGTPIALIAIGSYAKKAKEPIRNQLYSPLSETLARILNYKGIYKRGIKRGSQMGGRKEVREPHHHTAGGCLITLLLGSPSLWDEATLRSLCKKDAKDLEPYQQAAIARTLLHASYVESVPRALRCLAEEKQKTLFKSLVKIGKSAKSPIRTWRLDSMTEQWGTVLWILPCLKSEKVPFQLRHDLEVLLRKFLLAQSAEDQTGSKLLPKDIDQLDKGKGSHVFGSSIGLLAWRALEVCGLGTSAQDRQQASVQAQKMVNRIIHSSPEILELPVMARAKELEGYLGWSGLCLAAASLGIQSRTNELLWALDLAEGLNSIAETTPPPEQMRKEYHELISRTGVFKPEVSQMLARIASKIAVFYRRVKHSSIAT